MKAKKLTRAEREALASYEALQKKWDSVPRFSRTRVVAKKESAIPALTTPPGRETPKIPSLDTGLVAATKPLKEKRYTGTNMLGIGTLHKSNAVPVFSSAEATDMAKMRRG